MYEKACEPYPGLLLATLSCIILIFLHVREIGHNMARGQVSFRLIHCYANIGKYVRIKVSSYEKLTLDQSMLILNLK
jgi:hypothetical protein